MGVISSEVSASATFELTVKNPCTDSSLVTISKTPLPSGLSYVLFSSPHEGGFSFVHDPFELTSSTIDTGICGDLSYNAYFGDTSLTKTSNPIKYDSETRTFTIYSEDSNLIGD